MASTLKCVAAEALTVTVLLVALMLEVAWSATVIVCVPEVFSVVLTAPTPPVYTTVPKVAWRSLLVRFTGPV